MSNGFLSGAKLKRRLNSPFNQDKHNASNPNSPHNAKGMKSDLKKMNRHQSQEILR